MGSRNKYEMDHESGQIRLDRTLFTSTRYPADYGFIEGTLGEDGDPLDCLVLVQEPTFPGCVISGRPIGVLRMRDEKGADAKIVAVPTGDVRNKLAEMAEVPEYIVLEIRHFFEVYKDLEPGKSSEVGGWEGAAAAEREIEDSRRRYQEASEAGGSKRP